MQDKILKTDSSKTIATFEQGKSEIMANNDSKISNAQTRNSVPKNTPVSLNLHQSEYLLRIKSDQASVDLDRIFNAILRGLVKKHYSNTLAKTDSMQDLDSEMQINLVPS